MKTADAKTREQLQGLRERLQSLRHDSPRLQKAVDDAREAFGELDFENAGRVTELQEFQDVEQAVREERTNAQEIMELEGAEALILGSFNTGNGGNGHVPSVTPGGFGGTARRLSAQQLLATSDEYQRALSENTFNSPQKFGTVNLVRIPRAAQDGDDDPFGSGFPPGPPGPVLTTPYAPGQGDTVSDWLIPPDFRGLQPHTVRPLTLYDLVPKGTTNSQIIVYVQVTHLPAGFDFYEEGEIKPELTSANFDEASAPVRNIAGWLKLSRIAMTDMPFLASLIQSHLPYELRRKLEQQMIVGDGSGQNMTGLLNTDGILNVTAADDDTVADAILRGITLIRLADESANFVALNPIDWQNLATAKSRGGGEYMFDFASAMAGLPGPTIWGLRALDNRVLEHPLIGDSTGFGLYFREGITVRTSDSDQDDFVRNMVTVLCETRAAFVVWRPQAFCVVEGLHNGNGNGGGVATLSGGSGKKKAD